MKALVGTFNQEKALVGAFSVITNLRMDLRFKLYQISTDTWKLEDINYQHLLLALIIQT